MRILIAAGGTGGHIFPAVAVLEALSQRLNGAVEVSWLGSTDRMESTLIPEMGIPYTPMPIKGLSRLLSAETLLLPFRIGASIAIARRTMRLFRPHVVLVTGAYISYPAGVAAKQLGLPLVVMESNVNLGKSNRQLANAATLIALSFEESLQHLPPHLHHKARVTGNPVRLNIQPGISSGEARSAFGLHQGEPTVLVMGGSLGARSINNAVQRMVEAWSAEAKAPYQLIWQTGRQFVARVPDELKGAVVTQEFIANVGMAYAAASLVVCRSGATTVAELGVMGKPAILVPLPSASTDEQRRNAEAVALRNAAMLLPDAELGALLPSRIHELLSDPPRLEEMARCMQELARPKAADVVAAEIESIWRRA